MVASQSAGDPTVAYGPARLQKSYAQLQQNAALQGDSLKVAHTVPLKVHHSSETLQKTCPLLFNLLSEKPSDSESFTTKSSSSEQTNAKMAFNTIAHVSGKRHHKDQQAASLPALNCGPTRTQHLHHSGRTPSTPHQQQVSSPSLSLQPSTDKVLSVGETKPPTNDEIHAIISKKLTYYCNYLTLKKKSDGHSNKELGRISILQSDLLTTSEEGAMIDECCAAVEQYNCLALEEDDSKGNKANAELMPQFNETGDCATSATEKHSTEYPHIMLEVAATCTKNEEESPVVLTAVPETTWDDRRELQPTLVLNPSSSQEYKSLLTSNRNLDDIDQVPGVSWALNHMTEKKKKKGDATLKPVGTVGLDSAQRMVDVAEDPQTKSNSVVSGNGTLGFSLINRNAKRKKSIEDQQHAREVAGSAHSQTNSSIAVPENKLQKHARRCESKVKEAPPLYEDISDNDVFQLTTELQNTELPTKEHWEFSSPTRFEVPQYEDISEAESRTESMAVETTIPTLVAAPNDMQSTFENGGYGHVQGRAQMKTETLIIAHYCSESELCLKRGCGRQTKPSVSCSPSSVLSEEDTADDEMDDDHLVIPISILNLRYEPEDEDQDIPETNVPSPKRCLSPKLAPATAFPPVLVFDTPESFLLSENIIVALGSSSDEHEMDSEGDVETIQKRRGSSDSGDTEDSFDYSSASESNYMTVSKKMLKKSLAPVPSKTNDSLSEEEREGNEVTNMQKDQTWAMDKLQKPRQHLQRDDIIIVDSDTEDESDQKCKIRARRKRKRLRLSGDSDDALCSQQKRHLPETFKDKIPKNRPPSLYPPAPLHQSKHDPLFQVVAQDASSDPSKCTEKSGQQAENKAASAHGQHKTSIQNISSEQSVIIINSDDEHDQDYEMPRICSSRLHEVDAPCVRPEGVDCEWGPGEDKLHETGPSLADSPLSQHQSKLGDRQFRETTEDESSDLKHSGQQIEEGGGSEHVPHKAKRQRTSKTRVVVPDSDQVLKKGHFSKRTAVTKEIFSSGSEDSGGGDNIFASKSRLTVSVDRLCENAKTKPKKNELSSEDLPEKQPVMKDVNSHLLNNFVIPRYVVESSGPKGGLKLLKEPAVHKQGKDGTLSSEVSTESSKRTDSCEKNKAPSYKKVRFFTPVPANDKKQATKNNVQANARKPARVSRQLSLPEQEGPSTSLSSLSSTSRQLPVQARRSSVLRGVHQSEASSRLPYNPRELSFPPNKLRSCSSSSTLNHPPLKGPASTTQLNATGNAKEHVNSDRPIRGDRRFREDNVRPERSHHDRASGDRAPRKRHNLHKPATILMKRSTNDAKQWTKAINRVSAKERRDSVGEGYKWSEKPTVAKSTKGSSWEEKMGRSPPRPYL